HAVEVQRNTVGVTQATQLSAEESARESRVDVELVVLNQTESLVEVLSEVSGLLDVVTGRDSAGNERRVNPRDGLVHAEEHGGVKDATELLRDERANLAPEVKLRVVQHVLVHGHDHGD